MRKPDFCLCENKLVQISFAVTAQELLISDFVIATLIVQFLLYLHSKFRASLEPPSVTVRFGFCQTRLETPKYGFLTLRLIIVDFFKAGN